MIRIRGKAAVYGEIWYDEAMPACPEVDILTYRQQPAPRPRARCRPSLTIVSDLAVPQEGIVTPFVNTCRYQIRRAAKEGLRADFIDDPASRLDEFCELFDAFAQQKALEPADRRWLAAACSARQLLLTSVSGAEGVLVWHAYLVCGASAWLQYSGSCFRSGDADFRSRVGRANRWLHWQDMVHLKGRGVTRYDWGGMFEDESTPERAGINNFKRTFGGRIERRYDCTVPVTARGRIYLPLRDAWRRWRAAPQPAPAAAEAT